MYNKLFTKILDSSIWLEDHPTRIVWITFIACMDEEGIVALSGMGNVASRARVSEEEASAAIHCLENPDTKNPDQDHEGRRIERIPGVGWFVYNAEKYRNIVKREESNRLNRERVQRFRAKKNAESNGDVMPCNDLVMDSNETVMQSDQIKAEQKESKSVSNETPKPDRSTKTDEEWLETLRIKEIYAHIDFDHEFKKAVNWIDENPPRRFTRKYFTAWLNRIERPVKLAMPRPQPSEQEIKMRQGLDASRDLFYQNTRNGQ